MSTLRAKYRRVFQMYEEAHGNVPASAQQVAQWGVERGLLQPRPVNVVARLAAEISEALAEDRGSDGHRRNLARRAVVDGQTTMLWGCVEHQDKEFVEAAVQDWRKQIAGQCKVVEQTLRHRAKIRPDEGQIAFCYDFTNDVAEGLLDETGDEPPEDPPPSGPSSNAPQPQL